MPTNSSTAIVAVVGVRSIAGPSSSNSIRLPSSILSEPVSVSLSVKVAWSSTRPEAMLTALSWSFVSAPWSSARNWVVVTAPVALSTAMVNTSAPPAPARPWTTPPTSESTTA